MEALETLVLVFSPERFGQLHIKKILSEFQPLSLNFPSFIEHVVQMSTALIWPSTLPFCLIFGLTSEDDPPKCHLLQWSQWFSLCAPPERSLGGGVGSFTPLPHSENNCLKCSALVGWKAGQLLAKDLGGCLSFSHEDQSLLWSRSSRESDNSPPTRRGPSSSRWRRRLIESASYFHEHSTGFIGPVAPEHLARVIDVI